jgi:N,N'-diacetyllegionaminate synthase
MTDFTDGSCRMVAEAGACAGSVGWALRAAKAAAEAGFWAFKVQMYDADELASATAVPYSQGLAEPATQREAYARTISFGDWCDVAEACDLYGLTFFPSVFGVRSLRCAVDLKVPYLKVASADITYRRLLLQIRDTGIPVMLSTGAATLNEVERAVHGWLAGTKVILLACTLAYPAADANLGRIETLRRHFPGLPVGYSDHTLSFSTPKMAAAAGACLVEKHWTVTPGWGGDHDMALYPAVWDRFDCGEVDAAAALRGDGRLLPSLEEQAARSQARRSLVAATDLPAGHKVTFDDLVALRPGTGVPAFRDVDLVGRRLLRPYSAGDLIGLDEPSDL